MTNRIIKKSHFAKSKIFITFLCIFGLAFSYGCRKSGGGGVVTTDPTVITPSYSKGVILVADASSTTTSLSITFDNVNAKLDSVTVDGIADLSTADFKYDGSALKLNGNFDKFTDDRKKITAVFTLTAKNSGETLTKTTETVEALIVKKKEANTFVDKIKAALTILNKINGNGFEFYFKTYADNKLTTQNEKRYTANEEDTISPDAVDKELKSGFNDERIKKDVWASVGLTNMDDSQVGGDRAGVISFTYTFTLTDSYKAEYGIGTYDFIIEATAKTSDNLSAAGKTGKWANTTSQS